jgi:hypothetical protein
MYINYKRDVTGMMVFLGAASTNYPVWVIPGFHLGEVIIATQDNEKTTLYYTTFNDEDITEMQQTINTNTMDDFREKMLKAVEEFNKPKKSWGDV